MTRKRGVVGVLESASRKRGVEGVNGNVAAVHVSTAPGVHGEARRSLHLLNAPTWPAPGRARERAPSSRKSGWEPASKASLSAEASVGASFSSLIAKLRVWCRVRFEESPRSAKGAVSRFHHEQQQAAASYPTPWRFASSCPAQSTPFQEQRKPRSNCSGCPSME